MARDQDGRIPFESGDTIKVANPVETGMNINEATNKISEILNRERDVTGVDTQAPESQGRREVQSKIDEKQGRQRDEKGRYKAKQHPDEDPDVKADESWDTHPKAEEDDDGLREQQETKAEDETQPEPVQEEQAEASDEEVEGDHYELEPAALAEFLGVDEDDLILSDDGGLSLRAKVDGKVSEVGLRELRDAYQLSKASQARMQQLAEERKEFEATRTQKLEQAEQHVQYLGQAIQAIEGAYANEFRNVDWQRLRSEDPEGYAVQRQAFDERMIQVNQFKQHIAKVQEQAQRDAQTRREERWAEGFRRLNDVFTGKDYHHSPKWDEAEKDKLANYMVQAGMSPDELGKVDNWLVFKWARDSMLRQAESTSAQKTARRLVKLPRVAKPGASKTPKEQRQTGKRNEIKDAQTKQRKAASGHRMGKSNLRETADLISKIMRS